MEINRAAFGALAVFGIFAAGGGAYLANRHNEPALEQSAPLSPVPATGVVTETENSIATTPAALQENVAPAQVHEAAPVRPAATTRRATTRTAPAAERARATQRPAQPSAPISTPSSSPVDSPVAAAIEPLETTTVERSPAAQDPPRRTYDELTIPADSVIGLQVENTISSDSAKVEQQVRARVTRDVRVQDRVAIPAGARAEGSISLVERGGRLKDRARLGVRFHTIVLADGTRLPINTETIYREGDSPVRESAAKIGGGAVGGAVLGAILGGKKGALIGSTVGAAGGGVAVATSEANAATLPAGSTVTVRIGSPATVTVER
ncbi:MAG TPA: hypothetical protein VJM31_08620 [Vicinamibacterales bacterium]|nr:hypothetical protein [Vicinamibacterales bacterium]